MVTCFKFCQRIQDGDIIIIDKLMVGGTVFQKQISSFSSFFSIFMSNYFILVKSLPQNGQFWFSYTELCIKPMGMGLNLGLQKDF